MTFPQRLKYNAFTLKANGRANRITSPVTISKAFDPDKEDHTTFQKYQTQALWDTGATQSVITQATARALGLVSVGRAIVNHAGGSSPSDRYMINMLLPNNVAIVGVLVTECPDIAGHFGAIVGMDIISEGDLAITNVNGITCMSFRLPSIQEIDYVAEAQREFFSRVGRNDPCPCGKRNEDGKPIKFKHCHGK